ncbi:hypothetical protein K435DRAFT_792787 [Dendrothele bispora CBS 962.96]|uniref:Retrotransposon Copia-like N-terminal domain-containing protein n=1 Tax=Dendrothele bispora (strain CBS 962.96) TaxID=1314807 RepID=A0A4S8MIB1_DENBC|nr:hypothetical protein K435DRAFT_792787 [Dendrothele bispora CBS 962.96]
MCIFASSEFFKHWVHEVWLSDMSVVTYSDRRESPRTHTVHRTKDLMQGQLPPRRNFIFYDMAKDSEMTKLQGDSNYGAWELCARVAARSAGLLDTILGIDEQPTTGPNSKLYKVWKNRRDAATELIVKRMEDTTLTHVRGYEENPAGLWVHLASLYADSGVGAAIRLLREFAAVKYRGGVDDMAKVMGRIRNFKDLITTLKNSKEPLMIYDVEIALIRRARNLKDDGNATSSGGVTDCFREGGGKEGQYPQWYLDLRKKRDEEETTAATATTATTATNGRMKTYVF